MKKWTLISILLAYILIGCGNEKSDEPSTLASTTVENHFDNSMQLQATDRNPKAEELFLDKLKTVIKAGDTKGFKQLYHLKNANPEYVAMIDYIFNKKWPKHFDDLEFIIEPNQKAKQNSLYFTVPYLGDLIIKSISGKSVGTTKVPVGIKDDVYYITIGAKR